MPIEAQLLQDCQVILYRVSDPFDLAEFGQTIKDRYEAFYAHNDQPIPTIIDLSQLSLIPTNTINFMLSSLSHRPIDGPVVVIRNDKFTSMIVLAVRKIFTGRMPIVRTLEQAFAEIDLDLPYHSH